jgi:exopolysaccharide biosynthesis polyprenyl glycosylphosphotransferase
MSAVTEHAALVQGLELHDELTAVADDRTLEILERRRRTAVVHRRGWLVRRLLLIADFVGLVTALLLSEWIVNRYSAGSFDTQQEIIVFLATLPGWVVIAKVYGLYDRDEEQTDHSTADEFAGVFHMVTVCTWLFTVGSYLSGFAHPTAAKLVLFWAAATALVSTGRASARAIARRNAMYLQNTVIVGAGDVGQLVAKKLLQHPEYGINLVGFVDENPKVRRDDLGHLALLGGVDRIAAIVRLLDVERVIIAFSNETHERTLDLIHELKDLDKDVQIDIVPRLFEALGPGTQVHPVEGISLVGLPRLRLTWSSLVLKRAIDAALSAVGIIVAAPLLAAIAIAIRLTSAGPVLYQDARIGRNGELFTARKFRTMHADSLSRLDEVLTDEARRQEFERTRKLRDDPRITPVGRFLRQWSLDELPQLFNVLRGDVSLVGPRPITKYEFDRFRLAGRIGERRAAYWHFDLRPGLTGYWQINGRSGTDYEDRLRLDLTYMTHWSLALDLEIIAKTARVLFARSGAY